MTNYWEKMKIDASDRTESSKEKRKNARDKFLIDLYN